MTTSHSAHASVAYNGFLYCVGGDWQVDVSYAEINANGTVGPWQAAVSLPGARRYLGAVAYNGYLYSVGGSFSPDLDTLVAPINPDVADVYQTPETLNGFHSQLVDLGADTSSLYITINGHVPQGGAVRLQVRMAPDATGVFGAESIVDPVTLGSAFQVVGTGRYVWIRVMLDDTASLDLDDPTYVTDITVSGTAPPSPGTVFDGPGADIDSQSSNSMIEAHWSGFTAGAGDSIASYEWAIGTAPGLINVQGWVNVGAATSATNSSLSMSAGVKYVSVRAVSALGLVSSPATSDGVQVLPATTPPGGGGGSDHKNRCGQSADATPGSAAAILAGLALLALGRRRW
jgi:MYXO-CTERM domain-containing protein